MGTVFANRNPTIPGSFKHPFLREYFHTQLFVRNRMIDAITLHCSNAESSPQNLCACLDGRVEALRAIIATPSGAVLSTDRG